MILQTPTQEPSYAFHKKVLCTKAILLETYIYQEYGNVPSLSFKVVNLCTDRIWQEALESVWQETLEKMSVTSFNDYHKFFQHVYTNCLPKESNYIKSKSHTSHFTLKSTRYGNTCMKKWCQTQTQLSKYHSITSKKWLRKPISLKPM